MECFESLDLTQLVTGPTQRTPNVANLLDVFATSSLTLVANVIIIIIIIIIFVYLIADIPRNLTLLTAATQGGAK